MFQPIVIGTGLVAWRNLQRTLPDQLATFSASAAQDRLTNGFIEKASSLTSADAVVEDRQVLQVALGAYGLQDDIDNRYFINRILSEGATDDDALANRMTDSRYERLASDFALDGVTQFVGVLPNKAEEIADLFNEQSFALAVGNVNEDLRLALNAETELSRIAELDVSDDAKWYLIMGNAPLRSVMESALSLPSSFGQLDVDKQLEVFREKSESAFGVGEVDELAEDAVKSKVIDLFLLKEQLSQGQSLSSQNIALQLLQT
ncbi:DUF1217 domain-containing protein [Planktotalea sp.]|uniref:DUF1217 domain-containing protein n=1 Tax=Planktotalea sp. TaxID=2029877 RepID=UPI003298FAA3